ncbi:hypothetical protein C8F01DRAFT_1292615 [Mycena amicta]|nr:hypothetical protein C8F01DRAFT_1322944 [Mycena amicta]KAJ7060303.1 hypothetical protein C8F01DRAFT_1292615 [Mycena amicta]
MPSVEMHSGARPRVDIRPPRRAVFRAASSSHYRDSALPMDRLEPRGERVTPSEEWAAVKMREEAGGMRRRINSLKVVATSTFWNTNLKGKRKIERARLNVEVVIMMPAETSLVTCCRPFCQWVLRYGLRAAAGRAMVSLKPCVDGLCGGYTRTIQDSSKWILLPGYATLERGVPLADYNYGTPRGLSEQRVIAIQVYLRFRQVVANSV